MDARLHDLFRPVQANGRVSTYIYEEKGPSPALKPYVCCYWQSEPRGIVGAQLLLRPDAVDRVLPDGCTDIIFTENLKTGEMDVRYCGTFQQAFTLSYEEGAPMRSFGIRFMPGGAYPFLRTALSEFHDQAVAARQIGSVIGRETEERVREARSFGERIGAVEACLMRQLSDKGTDGDNRMKNVLYRVFISGGGETVSELARSETVSTRQLHRSFNQWVGLSPKKFAEVVRFQRLLRDIQAGSVTDWAAAAAERGFFDQAHMIREFKRFYGASPIKAAAEYRGMSDLSYL
ncbi:DUF6597 domain-containing transcriptional factor [Paenibacillus chitinolyticus]|uniref:DUF6597 domain-containing transcriptional factor n=1 Tax=Paenibacillus chitinolyticus TaxID=79263 RepID=UPI003556F6B6